LDELVDRVNAIGDQSGENPRAFVEEEERARKLSASDRSPPEWLRQFLLA
jgi:hypothetical protein